MTLARSYTLLAPLYDALVEGATRRARRRNLAKLTARQGERVLLPGIGTGLDIPDLPAGPAYVGIDLTPAMLRVAERRRLAHPSPQSIQLTVGDAMRLPFAEGEFQWVVMHLILAVVPEPARALAEAARVLAPGGQLLILDKFLKSGQRAPLRRLVSPLISRIATRTDVELEPLLARHPELQCISDEPAMAGGWFRNVHLEKQAQ